MGLFLDFVGGVECAFAGFSYEWGEECCDDGDDGE